jgi:hypothetical protein
MALRIPTEGKVIHRIGKDKGYRWNGNGSTQKAGKPVIGEKDPNRHGLFDDCEPLPTGYFGIRKPRGGRLAGQSS